MLAKASTFLTTEAESHPSPSPPPNLEAPEAKKERKINCSALFHTKSSSSLVISRCWTRKNNHVSNSKANQRNQSGFHSFFNHEAKRVKEGTRGRRAQTWQENSRTQERKREKSHNSALVIKKFLFIVVLRRLSEKVIILWGRQLPKG